ncbi:gag protease polyprotein [Cucumis melo var. makuwa]|uniref:Gag protease polyprotein n=1 Tax=Cucumis melo var. makuwa TaxID=1194695 RepID=A0A5D3CXG8_CUCMM|nr:gag protease polyprotein [Cucumis melo var. makuwa]TYK16040.1 gag protease polyprotein [Cucumis melo var. makuwa]
MEYCTLLICASFGIARLMCAFYGTTRLFMYSEKQTDEGQEGCVKAIWTRLVFFMLPLMYFVTRYFHCSIESCGPCCYGAEVQGFDFADAGAAAACPASSYFSSSCAPGRAGSVVGRGQALEGFQEDQKVQCAVFMLTDSGTAWWETTERMPGGDVGQITWQQFKESFYAKFFSASLKDAKRQEFLNLEQDDMTVEEYDAEFDMLSCFAPEMIATEAARADNLQERANSSKVAGRSLASGQKRKAEQQPISVPQRNFRSGGEFRRFQQKPFEAGEAARGKSLCTTCGKHHLGRCLFGTRTCFKCRQERHTTDRCPMRLTGNTQNQGAGAPHQGKVFATNKTGAERAGTVVTGTLPVLGHYALVLFDSGSSHSFISSAFVLHARLEVEPLHHVLSVSTPSGECMLSKEKVKACQIEIAGHVIEVTLLVLDMLDFDVILGMDWLAANHVSIDCFRKEVAFNTPSMASFKFKGEGSRSLPQVISAMRASKLLSHGTLSILASVVDTRKVDVSLSSEPVVRDYSDVFPEELPGLPPQREIEFAIELEPGTVLISKAPYRMAPAKLKELKVQL